MIFADIKGKNHVPEDMLTSNCIGLLSILPPIHLISFLSKAINSQGEKLNIISFSEIEKLEFWPYMANIGEPDVLCILKKPSTNDQLVLIIECKHDAGKSGHGVIGDDISDQLSRYYLGATKYYKNKKIIIIYLTHHRFFPKKEIKESVDIINNNNPIFWISWFHLYEYILEQLMKKEKKIIERKIFELLKSYLETKGYQKWRSWCSIKSSIFPKIIYTHKYNNMFLTPKLLVLYKRKYNSINLTHKPAKEVYNVKYYN